MSFQTPVWNFILVKQDVRPIKPPSPPPLIRHTKSRPSREFQGGRVIYQRPINTFFTQQMKVDIS